MQIMIKEILVKSNNNDRLSIVLTVKLVDNFENIHIANIVLIIELF